MVLLAESFLASVCSSVVARASARSNFWHAWHGVVGVVVGPRVRPCRAARSHLGCVHVLARCLLVLDMRMHLAVVRLVFVRAPLRMPIG